LASKFLEMLGQTLKCTGLIGLEYLSILFLLL